MPTLKEIVRGFEQRRQGNTGTAELKNAVATLTETETDEYEERATIMEYDGGLPRSEAERQALEIVVKRRTEE